MIALLLSACLSKVPVPIEPFVPSTPAQRALAEQLTEVIDGLDPPASARLDALLLAPTWREEPLADLRARLVEAEPVSLDLSVDLSVRAALEGELTLYLEATRRFYRPLVCVGARAQRSPLELYSWDPAERERLRGLFAALVVLDTVPGGS
ncbi:MAG: hypothetical protein JXX28_07040 [Deltaproteobacteria bacterium]|nr:hypothetical protein [Deltaproteobacteria bacterium]